MATRNLGISNAPTHITHRAPLILVADFHTAFICSTTSNQPYVSLCAGCLKVQECKDITIFYYGNKCDLMKKEAEQKFEDYFKVKVNDCTPVLNYYCDCT